MIVYEWNVNEKKFPFGAYENTPKAGGSLFFHHWHKELEILLMLQGEGDVEVEGQHVRICAGEAALVGVGQLHAATATENGVCLAVVIDLAMLHMPGFSALDDLYVHPMASGNVLPPAKLSPDVPWQMEALKCITEAIDAWKYRKRGCEVLVATQMLTMLSIFMQNNALRPVTAPTRRQQRVLRLKRVIDLIDKELSSPLRVQDLAAQAGMSVNRFYRFFREMTGETPQTYVRSWRLCKAEALLLGEGSVLDIALECGFYDAGHLIKVFKEKHGMTPGDWRVAQKTAPKSIDASGKAPKRISVPQKTATCCGGCK